MRLDSYWGYRRFNGSAQWNLFLKIILPPSIAQYPEKRVDLFVLWYLQTAFEALIGALGESMEQVDEPVCVDEADFVLLVFSLGDGSYKRHMRQL